MVGIRELRSDVRNGWAGLVLVSVVAVGLAYLFWRPLWHGGGLVGGDTYAYYFPQKSFLADELREGRVPLWNSLVGHGYPTVGESQTAVLYPPNLVLFSLLPVNAAYNASQLLHYVLAFVAVWAYARRLGLRNWGAGLCAVVYVYGWFAPRICLEWAIIGGVYLPLLGWCAESYLQTRRGRYPGLMAVLLGMHLLAGHFNLAFIEVLAVVAYSGLRLWFAGRSGDAGRETASIGWEFGARGGARTFGAWSAVVVALIAGFGLAAVQLGATWELKQRSQRADVGGAHNPGYGHLPPWYLVQVATPWMWYAPYVNADDALASITTLSYPAATNKVEAHLYFGLVPLALAVVRLWRAWRFGEMLSPPLKIWLWIGLAAVFYATGWLLPITRHLPGFSFFIGPGRYGVLTTLAVGLLAGDALDRWVAKPQAWVGRVLLIAVVSGLTVSDLWNVRCHWNRRIDGAPNCYAELVFDPPIAPRGQCQVSKILSEWPAPVRMWSTYQNMPTITGYAMTPTYLGLSPAEYLDPELTIPKPADARPTAEEIEAQVVWLRRAGVTHILSEQPLDTARWPVEPVWSGIDPLLNRAWGRSEPLSLYALTGSRGRASLSPAAAGTARVTSYTPQRITIEANASEDAEVVLTDLAYPGWEVTVDGSPAEWRTVDGMYRGVNVPAGEHIVEWSYEPRSTRVGALISGLTAVFVVAGLWWLRRRRSV